MIYDFGYRDNLLKIFVSNCRVEIVMFIWVIVCVYFYVFYVFMVIFVYRIGYFYGIFGGFVCWIILIGEVEVRRVLKIFYERIMVVYFGVL